MVLKCNSHNFNLQSFAIIIKITLHVYASTSWDYGVKCYNLLFEIMLIRLAPAIIIINIFYQLTSTVKFKSASFNYTRRLNETNTWR